MPTERPFIDFYHSHGLTPTAQDISDRERHFERREMLYCHLGIPPSLLRDKRIVEFGPGTGHNALFTAACQPASYTLVDATASSLESSRALLSDALPSERLRVVESDILDYQSDERFDLVLCEAVIPTQLDPAAFLQHVAQFTAPGGLLVMTCMDSVTLFPEILRRYLAWQIMAKTPDFEEQVARLVDFFQPDLQALPGMSRRHEDWVIDQMIHPWTGPLFSVPEAIDAITPTHHLYGASPRFFEDWRWYKQVRRGDLSELAKQVYLTNPHNLMDNRNLLPPHDAEASKQIVGLTEKIYAHVHASERKQGDYAAEAIAQDVQAVINLLPTEAAETRMSLEDFVAHAKSGFVSNLAHFRKMWGRGQFYLSFIAIR